MAHVLMEFTGLQTASIMYRCQPSGHKYHVANNDQERFFLASEEDVDWLLRFPEFRRALPIIDARVPGPPKRVPQDPQSADSALEYFNRHRSHGGTKTLKEIAEERGISYGYLRRRKSMLAKRQKGNKK